MRPRLRHLSLTIMVSMILPLNSVADEQTPFRMLDRDRDGRLSPREVAPLSLDFKALDLDASGYLSRAEIRDVIRHDKTHAAEPLRPEERPRDSGIRTPLDPTGGT